MMVTAREDRLLTTHALLNALFEAKGTMAAEITRLAVRALSGALSGAPVIPSTAGETLAVATPPMRSITFR